MSDYLQRAKDILIRINELASITEEQGSVMRTYGTTAFVEGCMLVKKWMEEASLTTTIDDIGNVRGKLISKNKNAKTFVIGSHIDTVRNAGKFDGPLGVIIGIDLANYIISSKAILDFNLEIVAFCDEEGVRFGTTFLGSKVITNSFDKKYLDIEDKDGITLKQAIKAINGNANNLENSAILKDDWLGYYEIHIEQGPVLYEKNIPVAVVSAIAGQCRASLTFTGVANHAGTVPMDMRKDAMCCAAACISAIEEFALQHKGNLVATVGKVDVIQSATNVIPGKVICSLDIRSAEESTLNNAIEDLKSIINKICLDRKIQIDWNTILQTKPVQCDHNLNNLLQQSISESDCELVSLVSGAGHDAVPIAAIAPVCMLFVKCFEGISHHPAENAEIKDIAVAIAVSDNFLSKLILNKI